ncbi:MAG: cysteine--tRNA ligase [Candidatus Omnitrophica bacterium]|nr:cysteine--tRNA ligase [Candidatus Omnitrophota bacterium]
MIRFYNTLTRNKEEFKPIKEGNAGLYTCGPTVYDLAHIGNFRAYIFEDLLHRYLEYGGYKVLRVMNITDVDDKTIAGCEKESVSLKEYTDRYLTAFLEDMEILRLKKPDYLPRATEHIPEMVSLVKKLLDKGYAYEKDGAVYFSIAKFPSYGKMAGIDLSEIKSGARVDVDEYEKEDVRDFALWKEEKESVFWDTELGRGRPGWHIECSAMSMKYLGESFDIHTGGVDNIFPHHENEIAQSEAATGKKFVNYWMHCAHLLVNGEKMSKSKGNFYTLRDILKKGYNPVAVRYLLLSAHYRDPLNFSEKALKQAENTVSNYNAFYQSLDFCKSGIGNKEIKADIEKARKDFTAGLSDDLNISAALAGIFNLIKTVNIAVSEGTLGPEDAGDIKGFLEETDNVLVILDKEERKLSGEQQNLIKEREQARKDKDFKKSDEIRDVFKSQGILLEDTLYGTRWKTVKKGIK